MSDIGPGLGQKIERALTEHLAEEGGGMVTAFYFVAEYIDGEGEHAWVYATAPDQRMSTTAGLIKWAEGIVEYEQRRYLEDEEGGL